MTFVTYEVDISSNPAIGIDLCTLVKFSSDVAVTMSVHYTNLIRQQRVLSTLNLQLEMSRVMRHDGCLPRCYIHNTQSFQLAR
jgi:hypothetical protein